MEIVSVPMSVGYVSFADGFVPLRSNMFDEVRRNPLAVFNYLCEKEEWELAEWVLDNFLTKESSMTKVNYSGLSAYAMQSAGWKYTLGPRKGHDIEIRFETPMNGVEKRMVPVRVLPDADQIRLGLRALRVGKTERDRMSVTSGKNPTGHGAIPGPAKGLSPSADRHGRGRNEGVRKK